ncbi:MAG TPA: serine hydrolase domain-containing protein [Segetibacter sp.]
MCLSLKSKSSLVLVFSLLAYTTTAQVLPDSIIKKIDQLFSHKRSATSPGFSIGIVRNDSLIFSKGYGMANLEYSVPNSSESIYHMASVSKQFTAYCILLLEGQGKLKLDDDIRKYLTWFPDLKHKITIRHLLNHTSGIRDQWDLNVISGKRMDDVITQDYLLTLLSRQQALNFTPGAEYSYSNSNYTLMAEIVKTISGKSFRQFSDSAIFKPLGMKFTHVHDDHTELVPNRAYSYRPLDNDRFANAVLNYANAGATSLFTNVTDMAKWVMNFYNPKAGDASTIGKLTTKAVLNNGATIPYASGIIVDDYNGRRRFSHNGADAGYRTYVGVFPDEKIGFILLSNLSTTNIGAKATELTSLFIKPNNAIAEKKKIDSSMAKIKDTLAFAKYMGNYIADDGVQFSYNLKDQQVYWTSSPNSLLLVRGQGDTLVSIANPDVKFVFSGNRSDDAIVDQYWPGSHRRLKKYTPPTKDTMQLDRELREYVGTFYNSETDVKHTFLLEDHSLKLTSNQSFTVKNKLEYIQKDGFKGGPYLLKFIRNSKNQVTGYELNTGRIRHLLFNKINAKH